jgi:3-oxoacyl-[acyl-carrier protein] reductase
MFGRWATSTIRTMNIDLHGKNALVGGASAGIGLAVARELAALGASVTLLARTESALQAALASLDISKRQQHGYCVVDFSDAPDLLRKINELSANRPFHILINNTGGPPGGPLTDAKPEALLAALNNHLICNQLLAQALLPGMRAAGYGRIINVISTSVKEPIEGLGVSNTTRWAVAAWAKTWAGEVGQYGITVNNVLPGYTETERLSSLIRNTAAARSVGEEAVEAQFKGTIPMKRFGAASEIAAGVAFLASPAASYINGVNLPIDGGRTKSL